MLIIIYALSDTYIEGRGIISPICQRRRVRKMNFHYVAMTVRIFAIIY